MNIFTKVYGLAQQTSKLGSVLQRAFYGSSGRVTLFEQRNFAGRRLDLSADCQKLSDKNFPERCNSVQVENGAWVVYQEPNYRGPHYVLEKRDYNNASDWGSQSSTVGSMRRVRFNN
ncbi:gamma-crystallin N-like [Oncorhynchus nerka]|uniref:gamma-crystallin N-like n=1 Tax=Oncorhynchus nerka TaxID=8023 RepID=UPI0031B866B8